MQQIDALSTVSLHLNKTGQTHPNEPAKQSQQWLLGRPSPFFTDQPGQQISP
jgi:hypothetical protein